MLEPLEMGRDPSLSAADRQAGGITFAEMGAEPLRRLHPRPITLFMSATRFDAESGEAHYRKALALAEPRGMRPLVAHCHLGLGKLYRRIGERKTTTLGYDLV
jgi:hypothetical protein